MKKKHKQKHHKHTDSHAHAISSESTQDTVSTKFNVAWIIIPVLILSVGILYAVRGYRHAQEPLPINMESLIATGIPYMPITASKPVTESVATSTTIIATTSIVQPSATKSLPLPKLPAKKPVESKTLKGQEAIDYIKSLPLDVQKQIMAGQSQGTTTPK
jgi:hypothetical protein